jgi:DNA primase
MADNTAATRAPGEAGALRSGQDWATWLRQAHPDRPPGAPGHPHGESLTAALAALVHLARRRGFAVERGDCGDSEGFTSWPGRRIRVRADITPGQAVTALAHQLGHVLLHDQAARLDPAGTIPCGGLRKVEADSVAYLTAARLGINTAALTFPYVSSWAGTDPRARPTATIQAVTSRVLAAAATLTAHLDAELSPGATPGRLSVTTTPEPPRGHLPPVTARPQMPDQDIVQVNTAARAFFQSRLAGSWVPGYLTARGFGDGIQRRWQAGHAPASWDALTRHLRALGFPDLLLEAAGLARRSRRGTLIDTFRNRAMLPIRSGDGTVIAFIGRAPDPPGRGVPKYLNSPQTALYDKSEALFGLWEARQALAAGARPVIVEGPLDAIAVTTAGHGRFAGVAPCGTALTARHAGALSPGGGPGEPGILVAFDPDPPGRRAAVRAYHLLSQVTADTSAVILPPGHDPAQILTSNGPEALATVLASRTRPLADLVTDTEVDQWARWLDHAEGQLSALRAAAPVIAAMPPAHVARHVARLSRRLSFNYATVTSAVTTALPDVITTTGRPGTPASSPPRSAGKTALPRDHANHPREGIPARTSAVSGEQAAAQRSRPSRPASQSRGAGQDFPASAADAVKSANAATPLPRPPPPGPQAPSRRGRVTG